MTNGEKAETLAKGSYQRSLLHGATILSDLRGKARNYAGSYSNSAKSLIRRLEENRIPHRVVPGPKGGWFSSTIEILDADRPYIEAVILNS